MTRRPFIALALVVVLLTAFALWHLFELRFAGGDIYPPYSSLRADPLGARAWYESLGELPGVESRRLLEPLRTLASGRGTTLYVLGVHSAGFDRVLESEARELDAFVSSGGRVVIGFLPDSVKPYAQQRRERRAAQREKEAAQEKDKAKPVPEKADDPDAYVDPDSVPQTKDPKETTSKQKKKVTPKEDPEDHSDEPSPMKLASLRARWGFNISYEPLPVGEDRRPQAAVARRTTNAPPALPASLAWHSGAGLVLTNDVWRALYRHGTNVLLAERALGQGTIVLATDSYPMSNEALRRERHTGLLAWFAGENAAQVFDETHLGVELTPGVATLARRYRLHGLFGSLLLLAVLFLWKNVTTFMPPHDALDPAAGALAGRGGAEGFINLIRRAVPTQSLIDLSLAEWRRAFAHQRRDLAARATQAEAELKAAAPPPGRARDPVADYRLACRALSRRRT